MPAHKKRKGEDLEGKEGEYHPRKEWKIARSPLCDQTVNPIRKIVDQLQIPANPPKKLISLSIGDPTIFGNMHLPDVAVDAVIKHVSERKHNGYAPSTGSLVGRTAIAKKYNCAAAPVTPDDVILGSGASGALVIAISAACARGQTLLIPRPGFSLYATVCGHYGINAKYYDLYADRAWEADMQQLEDAMDDSVTAIIVNNPSNPCGAVYSEQHLLDLLAFAEKHKLIVIADEIYGHLTFNGNRYIPMATLTNEVPVLACGGLAKQYIVPGWRVGWVVIHDRRDRLRAAGFQAGMQALSQLILGPNTIAMAALPEILHETPTQYYEDLNKQLEEQAFLIYDKLNGVPGLKPVKPQGAIYSMIEIDSAQFRDVADGTDFANKLLNEEFVFVLPGSCFQAPNFVRVVFCAPPEILVEACDRIVEFCKKHAL